MSILDQLRAIAQAPASEPRRFAPKHAPKAVDESDDLTRILALPRRPIPSEDEMTSMAREMTARLRRVRGPDEPCGCALLRPEVVARGQNPCITELRPAQGWYLKEASEGHGVLGLIPVGLGKTGIDVLVPMVVPPNRVDPTTGKVAPVLAVLLIPPGLRAQFAHDYKCWAQHFMVPNLVGGPGPFYPGRPRIEVFAYSELSQPKNSGWFKTRDPDLIVADECQALRDRDSARTGRFLKHFAENERTKFFCHSGSLTTRGLEDYSHFAALALREGSPLPLDVNAVEEWAAAIDPVTGFFAAGAGKLRALCGPGENIRAGFRRRLLETPGVVSIAEPSVNIPLKFMVREPPKMPASVAAALDDVRTKMERPDGDELLDALEVATCARQVAAGFYLVWKFPKSTPDALILEWYAKRKAFGRELRKKLERRTEHMDSPGLLCAAAERHYSGYKGDLPTWASVAWPAWRDIEPKVTHVTAVKWIDDWLMRDAVAWGKENVGIIWYENPAVGQVIARLGGFPLFGQGKAAEIAIARELGNRTIVASRRAHGTGRNLQSFSRNLFTQLASDGGAYEQTIGRSHRPGQAEDEVTVAFYQHVPEYTGALDKAEDRCTYSQETTSGKQKLLTGTWVP